MMTNTAPEEPVQASEAGNRWVRAMTAEIAWLWLRFQPQSHLAKWYQAISPAAVSCARGR